MLDKNGIAKRIAQEVYRSLGGGDDDEARPPLQLDEMMPTIGRQRAGCLE